MLARSFLLCSVAVAGSLPLGAQELALCEPVRVSFCGGACGAFTLTATARLWHADQDRIVLDPVARLRLWLRADTMSREYDVIGLRESAVAIPGPDGSTWVDLATGWSRENGWLEVPLQSVDRLHVRVPRGRWAGARRGALVGAGIGLGLGLYAAAQPCTGLECFGNAIGFWGSLILGPPLGALTGAIVPGTRWSESLVRSEVRDGPRVAIPPSVEAPRPDPSAREHPGRCDRVHVTYCHGQCESLLEARSRVLHADGERLRLLGPERLEIHRAALTDLRVKVPRTRLEGTRHGAMWGAVAGTVVGLGTTGSTYLQCAGLSRGCPPLIPITPASALVGGLIGAFVGRSRPGERWTVVPVGGDGSR